MAVKNTNQSLSWTIQNSSDLYGIDRWGKGYFTINENGNIGICPNGSKNKSHDLMELLDELESRKLKFPLLIRFDDILEDCLKNLHKAFEKAINDYQYQGKYQGVFPIKCNQQRHVVEELITCGSKWNFGLEAGSKPELLIALSILEDPKALLICNGYKDQRYIETAILARQLGRQPIVVIEQASDVDLIIKSSHLLGASPLIGIRAKLSSQSSGRWSSSIGDKSKFGLSIPEILKAIKRLKEAKLLNELKLLHFHLGSQINDIGVLKDALQEAGQIYAELINLGAPMGYLDVGGGLGIDYDGSQTASIASTNYSLQNYANDVVATIKECCESKKIPLPTLITESGRAIASHFSILIFNILGKNSLPSDIPKEDEKECLSVRNLRETLVHINSLELKQEEDLAKLQEAWNDSLKFKADALAAFRLGYIDLVERAKAEQLTWACAKTIVNQLPKNILLPTELKKLSESLAITYYANLSVFRSAPDTWAIDQVFPIMPIHRLSKEPNKLGHFADLTCDSDGKLDQFIDNGKIKNLLPLHEFNQDEKYLIGLFLGGAYQEVMGNLHNLFGSTNAVHIRFTEKGKYKVEHVIRGNTKSNVLEYLEHDPEILLERLRKSSESAIQGGHLKIQDAQKLIEHVEASLRQSTYLQS